MSKIRLLWVLCLGCWPGLLWSGESLRHVAVPASAQKRAAIVGGTEAPEGSWPWIAALVYKGMPAFDGQFCGGALVHPQWVLTAAHCVQEKTPQDIEVLLGRRALSADTGERLAVEAIVRYPLYDPYTFEGDLALLRLAAPSVQPTLPVLDAFSPLAEAGRMAGIAGWGKLAEYRSDYPDTLRQASVPIVSNAVCNTPETYAGTITDTMLCAGYVWGGVDACLGDSGGPLVVPDEAGGWQQAGIVSSGEGCARPGYYGVYTRLGRFKAYLATHLCAPQELLAAPRLEVATQGREVTLSWTPVAGADAYRLYYAPSPQPEGIAPDSVRSLELGKRTTLSVSLDSGTAFYVALNAYRGVCDGALSALESVSAP